MSSTIEPDGPGEKFVSEDDLKGLLEQWIAPEPSKSLDQRVANSYHMEFESGDAAAPSSALFPQSQKEVVTMKFCSTCKEEFADKFSFCPVDGTPLNAPVLEPSEPVIKPTSFNSPIQPSAPVMAAAVAGTASTFIPRGEYHVTFMDDAGLVSRLVDAVKEVAHESELTWPEFKRDPFGFYKAHGRRLQPGRVACSVATECGDWRARRVVHYDDSGVGHYLA